MRISSIVLTLYFLSHCLQLTSCGYSETPMYELKGPDDQTDLVFFYKKEASYEQKELFQNTVIHRLAPEGKGYRLRDGVIDLFIVQNSGYE